MFMLQVINPCMGQGFFLVSWPLRTYTKTFAKRAAFLYPKMVNKVSPPDGDVQEEFCRLWVDRIDHDTWDDAYMKEVVRYLLGAKGLNIPSGWEWIVPADMGTLV